MSSQHDIFDSPMEFWPPSLLNYSRLEPLLATEDSQILVESQPLKVQLPMKALVESARPSHGSPNEEVERNHVPRGLKRKDCGTNVAPKSPPGRPSSSRPFSNLVSDESPGSTKDSTTKSQRDWEIVCYLTALLRVRPSYDYFETCNKSRSLYVKLLLCFSISIILLYFVSFTQRLVAISVKNKINFRLEANVATIRRDFLW